MKRISHWIIVLILSAGMSQGLLQAQVDAPSKVTGDGVFMDVGWWASPDSAEPGMGSFEMVKFSVSIHSMTKAEVYADGPSLRAFWGGPLVLSGPVADWESDDPWMQDTKPAQAFTFQVQHPVHGNLTVWIFLNDNGSPGANEDPFWADWVGIVVEPADGDGVWVYDPSIVPPGTLNDNLFGQIGILVRGNVMDHRK